MKKHPHSNKRLTVFALTLLMLGGLLMFGLFGCGKAAYTVDYRGQKDAYQNAHDTYKAGEEVRLVYSEVGTDTDYSFFLDGEQLDPEYEEGKGFVLRFTMPAHNVRLECQAVNSMEDDDESKDEMLLDLYTSTVAAADGGDCRELVLYACPNHKWKLIVYRQDAEDDTESSTTYTVPYLAVDRCFAVIDEEKMRSWNDLEPAESEEGAITVCKFLDTNGEYVRVTSEAMPEGGAQSFARLREALLSYATEENKE
ncbi:MAG: hypothetical protein IKW76_13935 [Clostridia bacterium]|nr:hypothetical protein [Clostridia bacterium]